MVTVVGSGQRRLLMGGLSAQMPFVRNAFIVGAAALAGIPITNGFFSKELILEGGLLEGPLWAYVAALLGAGFTALYTARLVSLVFFGRPGTAQSQHETGTFMRVSLAILVLGTLLSWLLAGPLSALLAGTLPFQEMYTASTAEMVLEVLTAPATLLALVVVGLGIAVWLLREHFARATRALRPFIRLARNEFGFDRLNRRLTLWVQMTAEATSHTQTGQLNWNVAGIVGGLVMLLLILVWGTR